MISTTRCRSFLLAGLLVAIPVHALASVQITELMYDAPGADQDHEWVEVTNTGLQMANLTGWKFFEGGTNHGLSPVQGTSTLAAGESAVISSNPSDFKNDFPNYAGTLFKSSFSLSNTAGSVELKDAKLSVVSGVSYDSSLGAAGDGNTLHMTASGFVAGAPDPGVYAQTPPKPIVKPVAAAPVTQAAPKTASSAHASAKAAPASQQTAINFQAGGALPLPQESSWVWYVLGAMSLVVCALAAGVYLWMLRRPETSLAEEFDITDA